MELLDKKLTGPEPEISVHPSVTLFLSYLFIYLFIYLFFVTFFLTEIRQAACSTGGCSTLTDFLPSCN